MRIFVSVLYLLPFVFWSFLGIQTNFSSGPFQVTSTNQLGFSIFTRTEARALSNVDWMVIAVSYVTGLDFRGFFEMYGYVPSVEAAAQVAGFGYNAASQVFCLSTAKGYCKGQGFNAMTLPVDGAQSWPDETDTDSDQEWDYFDQDDDGDIMSDAFETTHGFDPLNASDALENADGDSMNNLSEYIAGTLPHDASSVFAIEQLVPLENGHVQIQWLGVPGRLYTVWGTDNLSFDFVKLREPEESLGAVESYVDMRSNITESFYKVEVGLP